MEVARLKPVAPLVHAVGFVNDDMLQALVGGHPLVENIQKHFAAHPLGRDI